MADRIGYATFAATKAALYAGYRVDDWCRDPEKVAKAQLKFKEEVGGDSVTNYIDFPLYAEAWGAATRYYPDQPCVVVEPGIKDPAEYEEWYENPPDGRYGGRCPISIKAAWLLRRECGMKVPIVGFGESGLLSVEHARGIENFMLDTVLQPDLAMKGVWAGHEYQLEFGKANFDAGAHVMGYDCACSSADAFSPEQATEMELKPMAKMFEELMQYSGGGPEVNMYHNCAKYPYNDLIHKYLKGKALYWSYCVRTPAFEDYYTDLKDSIEKYGKDWCLTTGIDHLGILVAGTPQEVEQHTKETLDIVKSTVGKNFFLAPGCELSVPAPIENVKAYCRAAEKYGVLE